MRLQEDEKEGKEEEIRVLDKMRGWR